jgi:hypothetical protein
VSRPPYGTDEDTCMCGGWMAGHFCRWEGLPAPVSRAEYARLEEERKERQRVREAAEAAEPQDPGQGLTQAAG